MYQTTGRIWAVGENQNLAQLCLAENVEAYARMNMHLRRANPSMPTLKQALANGFRYKDESKQICKRGEGCTTTEAPWMDWQSALDHGSADCKTFVAEEIAELRLVGVNAQTLMRCFECEPAGFCPLCRIQKTGTKQQWHVQTLHPDGKITDPSRQFGMAPHPKGDNAVIAPQHQAGVVQRIGW